ncbi:conserved hypothetical protein [Candidatus Koribacter versatilis Ellin345]|uniref:Lipoprotein n=1 Tax=Koribacter versatilis (strain Ellin345) TaxID=204669 RepID=Q1IJE3_KORVE|nr:hypothetical protein [Candidatus Koribacter versatilis]ABF43007.1 conserved hypothetical protein [Candidatus Koribacter versatilis Ellin345]
MKKRPISITIVSWVYIAAGCAGLIYHAPEWKTPSAEHWQIVWVSAVRLLAVVAGIAMLRGQNWSRWLTIAWMAIHVVISLFNSWEQAAMHAVLLTVVIWILVRQPARDYFSKTPA